MNKGAWMIHMKCKQKGVNGICSPQLLCLDEIFHNVRR